MNITNLLRQPTWLTRDRVIAWCSGLLIFQLVGLVLLACWQHGLIMQVDKPTSSDFVSFYAAGKLALAGTPALAYDQAAHYFAEQQARVIGAPYQFFFYPPVFLLLCAPLALLPYPLAYALFEAGALLPLLLVIKAILREKSWGFLVPALAFPAVFWNMGLGQNAFLTAALFAGFTLCIDRRPAAAGVLLGLLCYKPHFGLLAPVALLAGRRWTAFAAAAATFVAIVGLSVGLFGVETWRAYLAAFASSNAIFASGRIDYAGMITLFGAARLVGATADVSYALQAVIGVLAAALVALTWHRDLSQPVRAATLLAATLLAVPIALLYDQLLLLVAIAWLVRRARETGFLPWEKLGLIAIYLASLFTWFVGTALHIPLGPPVTVIVLLLGLRRAWREYTAREQRYAAPAPTVVLQTP